MNNLYVLNKNQTRSDAMHIYFHALESRGIPITIFIGYLNNIDMELKLNVERVLEDGVKLAGSKEVWLQFITDMNKHILIGSHEDFNY